MPAFSIDKRIHVFRYIVIYPFSLFTAATISFFLADSTTTLPLSFNIRLKDLNIAL